MVPSMPVWSSGLSRVCGMAALAAFGALWLASAGAAAQDASRSAPEREAAAEREAADDPYAVPEDAEPKELLEFIRRIEARRPTSVEDVRKRSAAISTAAERILAAEADEPTAAAAVRAKLSALDFLGRVGDRDAARQRAQFAESLKDDERPQVRAVAREQLLAARAATLSEMQPEERREFLDDITAVLQEKDEPTVDDLRLAMTVGQGLERAGDTDRAVEAYERFAAVFEKAEDERLRTYAAKLEGVARRLQLPGNEMPIEGETVDGEPFDWQAYRGKVVLVDFWATWCGPCIAELPNVKKNYELYRDKGFDIVAISLDDDRDRLVSFLKEREIPWTNLFSSDPETQGWNHPMATRYGIMAIPAVILVDREGKVVSLQARGPALGRLLEEHLGPAEEPQEEPEQE